jgi:hypothetical protein
VKDEEIRDRLVKEMDGLYSILAPEAVAEMLTPIIQELVEKARAEQASEDQ